jgi:hypothetical protein
MASPIIWKEWHEQRWKLVFGTVMMLFFAGAMAAARVMTSKEAVVGVWVFGGFILSLYSAMGAFAPEWTGGTLTFLVSKPLNPGKVFLAKWLFGWLNVIVPMAACGLLALLIDGRRLAFPKDVLIGPLAGAWMAMVFYTMTCCLAPRRAGEAQVGFFGLMVGLAYVLHAMLFQAAWGSPGAIHQPLFTEIIGSVNPLYVLETFDRSWSYRWPVVMPVQFAVFALVMGLGYRKWQRSI